VTTLLVNGTAHEVGCDAGTPLLYVLRNDLGLLAAKFGCGLGLCGACTVLVDGRPTRSCLMFGVQADDSEVETVEGLARDGELDPLQEAFGAHHALQCGFCTPGFLMLATALLRENPDPSDDEIREAMASNICRCTGYQSILEAVRAAADAGEAAPA